MKAKKLLILLILMCSSAVFAQDTIRHLIFTEWRGDGWPQSYIELTNVGDSSIDLGNFTLLCPSLTNVNVYKQADGSYLPVIPAAQHQFFVRRMSGRLDAGESYVVKHVWDGLNAGKARQDPKLLPLVDDRVHCTDFWGLSDTLNPDMELWAARRPAEGLTDSVDALGRQIVRLLGGLDCNVLLYHVPGGDSVVVDVVNFNHNGTKFLRKKTDVAGVFEATNNNILVRKAYIKKGNVDWNQARGIDAVDSEWIPLIKPAGGAGWIYPAIYTTIGTHGDFSVEMTSENIVFDKDAATMTIPWGIYKGDSVIHEMVLGPGMAWSYIEDTLSVEDSVHTIVQTGDILNMFACGDDLDQIDFKITVLEPGADMALVFPMKRLRYESLKDPEYTGRVWGPAPYYVTDEDPVIDTVGDVPFATRVDTLFKYLEKAPKANWEIVWVDGVERVDLKYGDILKVTAENGTTIKEYFIDVQEYAASENANLAAITWPDKQEFLEGWMGDTIPGFVSNGKIYTIILSYGTKSVPALTAIPQNLRANISEARATNLAGSLAERTTTFTVMSEDGLTTNEYMVTFEVEKPDENIQKFHATPFISELCTHWYNALTFVEIINPGNVPLDLSQYLIVASASIVPSEALEALVPAVPTDADFKNRYKGYVPGYKFHEDTASWLLEPGILSIDNSVNPNLDPGELFIMMSAYADRAALFMTPAMWAFTNKAWYSVEFIDNLGVSTQNTASFLKHSNEAAFIFKILNDSVLEGTKPVGDPADYEVVEAIGDLVIDGFWAMDERMVGSNNTGMFKIIRKPYVYTGARNIGEGLSLNPDSCDWTARQYAVDFTTRNEQVDNVGAHAMYTPTAYMSTISSTNYTVSDGYVSPQFIQGILSSKTVEQFYELISKADSGQVLSIHSGTDGSEKGSSDLLAGNDTLVVVSADGKNKTMYAMIDAPLDSDATLVKVNAISKLTISIDGATGTIAGMKYGDLLKNLVDSLIVPAKAVMHVINGDGKLLPLKSLNADTVYVDTRVGDDVYFEVLAQDGVTKITYKLEPAVLASDAFVISTIYMVNEASKIISKVTDGTSVYLFFKYTEIVKGATAMVIDKYGFERPTGLVSYDDRIKVVSQDGSKTVIYYLQFLGQPEPAINQAPGVTLAQSDFAIKTNNPTINVSATVTDDGLPLPAAVSYLWEVIEGDAAKVSIATANAMASDVTFSATGSYKLKFTADDGELITMAEVTVGVTSPTNTAPVVGVSFPSASVVINTALTVTATATDDGFPAPPGALTYKWSVKTGDASKVTIANDNQLETNVTISALGSYVLEFSADDGEIASKKEIAVTVTVGVGVAGVLATEVKVYPNPARDRFTIELSDAIQDESSIKIFNLTGKMVYQSQSFSNRTEINVSQLESGIYYLTVKSGEQIFTRKLQIAK